MLRRLSPAVFLLALSAVSFSQAISESIRHVGFSDFIQGKPGNSGVNLYVSRNGRVQVINQWDLNQDGYVDVYAQFAVRGGSLRWFREWFLLTTRGRLTPLSLLLWLADPAFPAAQ